MKTKNLKEKLRNNFYVNDNVVINLSNINYILPPTDTKQGCINFDDGNTELTIGENVYKRIINYLRNEKY